MIARARRAPWLVAFAAALSLVAGCTETPPADETQAPLLVFGIDGADWDRAIPLMRQGKLPALAALMRRGTSRTLLSLGDEWLSPTIWTTAATGVLPERHGILHFVTQTSAGMLPVTSSERKVAALWNILSARDRTVGVIGWLVTWPAEPVNGYVVAAYAPHIFDWAPERPIKGTLVEGIPHQVWPPELQKSLEAEKVLPDSVSDADLRGRFTERDLPPAPADDARASIHGMRWSWAADDTYRRIFHALVERNDVPRPDLEMLYFGSVDVISHRFWKYMDPSSFPYGPVPPDDVERFGRAVENAYRSLDEVLADVLSEDRDSLRVLVLSDHGFRANEGASALRSSGWHRPEGILLACGPGFRDGAQLAPGSVVDVAPTVLYALGLPVARDMDGEPALDLFTAAFQARHEIAEISSYEPEVGPRRGTDPVPSPVDDEILRRLDALGYIDR